MEDKICLGQNTVFIDQNTHVSSDLELNKLKSLLQNGNREQKQNFILGQAKNCYEGRNSAVNEQVIRTLGTLSKENMRVFVSALKNTHETQTSTCDKKDCLKLSDLEAYENQDENEIKQYLSFDSLGSIKSSFN